jgi:3-dehydroquinate dehydratase-2
MSRTVLLLSGPNLSQLGTRDPAVYGSLTLEEHVSNFRSALAPAGYVVEHLQSEGESELIQALHRARTEAAAIAINPGALTHYSWSLRDALAMCDVPKIEVHLSNPAAREAFRSRSTIAGVVSGSVAGFGALSYTLAAEAILRLLA